jgi:dTDP-4-dehydrorhamnose 3,5-epimerase
MEIKELSIPDLLLIAPRLHRDARGFFIETYSEQRYQQAGIQCKFMQDNHSRSGHGTLRGMHFQTTPGQAKLVRVGLGKIFDVAVDMRPASPTFGQWAGVILDAESHHQLFVPVGFGHGFCVLSEFAEVIYKVSTPYDGATESGFAYNDPQVGIDWPIAVPQLSARDADAQTFAEACGLQAPRRQQASGSSCA